MRKEEGRPSFPLASSATARLRLLLPSDRSTCGLCSATGGARACCCEPDRFDSIRCIHRRPKRLQASTWGCPLTRRR